jgi:hypothetical protein
MQGTMRTHFHGGYTLAGSEQAVLQLSANDKLGRDYFDQGGP